MSMQIIRGVPPIIDEIDAIFKVKGRPVVYAWGDILYNPEDVPVPAWLMAHECVHRERQGDRSDAAIRKWWDRYLYDREFRLAEELPAHRAELGTFKNVVKDRNQRIVAARFMANRLASAVYGNMITEAQALRLLLNR